jgi:hypothetical protein
MPTIAQSPIKLLNLKGYALFLDIADYIPVCYHKTYAPGNKK